MSEHPGARRLGRWLSLTLIHQGTWPLLAVLAASPLPSDLASSWSSVLARVAGPLLAAALAAGLLAQQRRAESAVSLSSLVTPVVGEKPSAVANPWRARTTLAIVLFAAVLAGARLVVGPMAPVAGLLLVGVADVAAFQLIHFGVVARSFPATERDRAQGAAVLLFGASWGIREAALTGLRGGDLLVALVAGTAVGLVVALLVRGLRGWPGGTWAAAAGQWLMVSLIFGFTG